MPSPSLELVVLSLRYSSWSMRAWLALTQARIPFASRTVDLPRQLPMAAKDRAVVAPLREGDLAYRRSLGSVTGLYPVLWVEGHPVHESLAICEWCAETRPEAGLWPSSPIERAQARALSLEMVSGFPRLRTELSCNVFARVPAFRPSQDAQTEISRVFELWDAALQRSGGPFLFGGVGIADCMYFPMLTRFATYGVELTASAARYEEAMRGARAVRELEAVAATAPRIPAYDEYIQSLGGVVP